MDMSIYFSSVKENLKDFKDLVVKEATEHPIAAIAFTIFPVLAIVAFCVWGARKIYRHYTNETVEKVNTATLPLFQRGLGYLKSKVDDCVSAVKSTPKETWIKAALCASAGFAAYKFFSAGELTPNPESPTTPLLSAGTNDLGQTLYYISDGVQCLNPPLELIPEGGIPALSSLIEKVAPIIPTPEKILKMTAASMLGMAVRGVSVLGVGAGLLYNHKTALPRSAPLSSHLSYLSLIGVVGGAAIGTLSSIWENGSLLSKGLDKGNVLCHTIRDVPLFSIPNEIMQTVIKNMGFFSALVPGAILLVGSTIKRSNDPAAAVLQGQIKSDFAKTTLMTGIAVVFKAAMGLLPGKQYFDPSGHVMLKACALQGMLSSLKHNADPVTKTMIVGVATLSMLGDALFMANTAGCYHTPIDIAAGTILSFGFAHVANKIVDAYVQSRAQINSVTTVPIDLSKKPDDREPTITIEVVTRAQYFRESFKMYDSLKLENVKEEDVQNLANIICDLIDDINVSDSEKKLILDTLLINDLFIGYDGVNSDLFIKIFNTLEKRNFTYSCKFLDRINNNLFIIRMRSFSEMSFTWLEDLNEKVASYIQPKEPSKALNLSDINLSDVRETTIIIDADEARAQHFRESLLALYNALPTKNINKVAVRDLANEIYNLIDDQDVSDADKKDILNELINKDLFVNDQRVNSDVFKNIFHTIKSRDLSHSIIFLDCINKLFVKKMKFLTKTNFKWLNDLNKFKDSITVEI